ncbi:MAG: alpha/beta fold hydrolase [Thermoplasmatota archaeon]
MPFRDRREAGQRLGILVRKEHLRDPVVVALPRGGVPVAMEVATALRAPMDVLVVRKLGVPSSPELGFGAVAHGDVLFIDDDIVKDARVSADDVDEAVERERHEVRRRVRLYRGERPWPDLRNRGVVVVDDGLATGGTVRAAVRALAQMGATEILVTVPVAPRATVEELNNDGVHVVALETPEHFGAVGQWYGEFPQLTDSEVSDMLDVAWGKQREVAIPADGGDIRALVTVPSGPLGVVIFVHGSGSGRRSPRNRFVAKALEEAHFATVLVDLLTVPESAEDERKGTHRFDIGLLSSRVATAIDWVARDSPTSGLPVGLVGASTGAAAAIRAAAARTELVRAVVLRGGRVDLAEAEIPMVRAPMLFIVGQNDPQVMDMNQEALRKVRDDGQLVVIPGATHLFEEPGALEQVADVTREFFASHLPQEALSPTW